MKTLGDNGLQTEYLGPSALTEINVGGTKIQLARPLEPDQLLDDPAVAALNQNDDYMPYWAYLWPGAFLLADVVAKESWSGECALEIGCGLGLAGLVGLSRGLNLRFTDYDSAPLSYIQRSAEVNGWDATRFSTGRLDWRELPDEHYPVILGADVLYERRLVPLVADVLKQLLSPGGLALIADPYRVAAEGFPKMVRERGLICEVETIETLSQEHGLIRGSLHRIRKPSNPG